jgi:hypothetical protein
MLTIASAVSCGLATAVTYPTKCKRLRATLPRPTLRRLHATFRGSEGLAWGHRILSSLPSQRNRAVPERLRMRWVVSGGSEGHYLRRDALPLGATREATEVIMAARESPQMVEEREKAEFQSSSGGAQESVQRPWWRRVFGS